MTVLLIVFTWLVVPALFVWLGVVFYVPRFLAAHRPSRRRVVPDELAARRAISTRAA